MQAAADALRRADVVAATLPPADAQRCLAFARTWGYDAVLTLGRGGSARLQRVADASTHSLKQIRADLIRKLALGQAGTRAED